MKLNIKQLLNLITVLSLGSIQAAEASWYEIEVIVFEQSNETRLNAERWDQQFVLPTTLNSKDFLSADPAKEVLKEICIAGEMVQILENIPVTEVVEELTTNLNEVPLITNERNDNPLIDTPLIDTPLIENETTNNIQFVEYNELPIVPEEKPFQILDKEFNQLNDLKKSLTRRRGYRPLLHISWRQPVKKKDNNQLIRLFAGYNYSETFNPEGDERVDLAIAEHVLFNSEKTEDFEQLKNQISLNQSFSLKDNDDVTNSPFGINSSELTIFGDDALQTTADYKLSVHDNINQCQQLFQKQTAAKHSDVWQLDGNIHLYVGRYLHIETDLYLRIPGKEEIELGALETSLAVDRLLTSLQINSAEEEDNNSTNSGFGWQLGDDLLLDDQDQSTVIRNILNKYVMKQSRRIRRNEIHYIDHPLFGLLIQIRPYNRDQVIEDPETGS